MRKKNFIILLILVFLVFSLIGIITALNRSGKLIITPTKIEYKGSPKGSMKGSPK